MRRIERMKLHWLFAVHSVAFRGFRGFRAVDFVFALPREDAWSCRSGSPNARGVIRVRPRLSAADSVVVLSV